MRKPFTITTMFDAGLLREYVAANYGHVLTGGGNSSTYLHAMRLVQRLAGLTGQEMLDVLDDLQADYNALELSL